jgi:lipopolysaccharide export system permease protein
VNLLDRYIFKSVLFTCAGAVGLFAFVLMIGNFMRELMPFVLAGQIDALMLVRFVGLLIPFVVTFALPMGVLTGILLTLGRLSADSEVTAMRASGIGLWRISRPVIILALLGAGIALYNNQEVMPWTRVTSKRDLANVVRANPLSFIVPRTFIRQFPGVVVYVGEKKGAALTDFWLWQLDKEQRVVKEVRAASGSITYDESDNALVLTLHKGQVEYRKGDAPEDFRDSQLLGTFDETEAVRLPMDSIFSRNVVRTKLDFMPRGQLQEERNKLSIASPNETGQQRLERERSLARIDLVVSERYNNALAVLSFALIGVPLGIKVSRRETSANLGVAVALALGYYFLTNAIGWLEKRPDWHPATLLFLPNLLFFGLAFTMFIRTERR